MTLSWRAMAEPDLDQVAEIAAIGFPDHFEGRAVFANRLVLWPAGCFVLAEREAVAGYLVSYPWSAESAPALNTVLEGLPSRPELIYLHDLALRPEARGRGWTGPMISRLAEQARAEGWPAMSLVAVNEAEGFWRRHGFEPLASAALADKLASYGPDARYMIRRL